MNLYQAPKKVLWHKPATARFFLPRKKNFQPNPADASALLGFFGKQENVR